MLTSRPTDGVLGRVPGMKGFHDINDFPEAETIPGLLIYRFNANLVFYNADYFKSQVLAAVAAAKDPVEWVLLDASSINVVDSTAVKKAEQLAEQLATRGIVFAVARHKQTMGRLFEAAWLNARRDSDDWLSYPTLKSAVSAFRKRNKKARVQATA
jgi:MFS superfamily sulfate permease-like transporter